MITITPVELKSIIENFSYKDNGDGYEIKYYSIVNDFPHSEKFWKTFVCPMTNRLTIEAKPHSIIRFREGISDDLKEIGSYHYSIFLNLIYANDCLAEKQLSFFENFYTHLATIGDLTEEFLLKIQFLKSECDGIDAVLYQKLKKEEFIELAVAYFEDKKKYSKDYEHYFSKGRVTPLRMITAENLLSKYFGELKPWKSYLTIMSQIRQYRNVVVHNKQLASRHIGTQVLVPKRSKIGNYKTWQQVFQAEEETLKNDFVERKEQMLDDLKELTRCLDALWDKPIKDLDKLLFVDKNETLLKHYNISFTNSPTGFSTFDTKVNKGISASEYFVSGSTQNIGASGSAGLAKNADQTK